MGKLQNVYKTIWLGSGEEVKVIVNNGLYNAGAVILNVADDFVEYPHPNDILYIHAGLNDGPPDWNEPYGGDNPIMAYVNAITALRFCVNNKKQVFVHCHAGVSRSPFVVVCYIALDKKIKYFKAKEFLHNIYDHTNPHPKHEQTHILKGISDILKMKI